MTKYHKTYPGKRFYRIRETCTITHFTLIGKKTTRPVYPRYHVHVLDLTGENQFWQSGAFLTMWEAQAWIDKSKRID